MDKRIIRILEIACHNLEEYGYETSHWSLNQLVGVVIKEGTTESISAKTISRFFNMGKIRPYLVRYWLHSSEKTDSSETFVQKVNEICSIYHDTETVHEAGSHTASIK